MRCPDRQLGKSDIARRVLSLAAIGCDALDLDSASSLSCAVINLGRRTEFGLDDHTSRCRQVRRVSAWLFVMARWRDLG
jgi:hypothetical protein